jgi:ABC-2 type transport system permease protein
MRSRKLMKRLMASPMKRPQFLASFFALRGLVLLIELPVLLVFAWLVFSLPIRGSLGLLLTLSVLGSLAFCGIGLLIASRAMNPQTFNGFMSFVTMPMFVFSGVFFPSSRFPEVMQPFLQALPLTALNDSMRAVILDGASVGSVAPQAAILATWSLVTFAAALRIFRWR